MATPEEVPTTLIARGELPNPCMRETLTRYRMLFEHVRSFLSPATQAKIWAVLNEYDD